MFKNINYKISELTKLHKLQKLTVNCKHFPKIKTQLVKKREKMNSMNPAVTVIILNLFVWPTYLTGNSALFSIDRRLDLPTVLHLPFFKSRCQLSIIPSPLNNLRLNGGGKRMNRRSFAPEGPWAEIGGKVAFRLLCIHLRAISLNAARPSPSMRTPP